MYTFLTTNAFFASLTDGEIVILSYAGMAAVLFLLFYIPFRIGRRAASGPLFRFNVTGDPTDKIVSDTSRALAASDPFGLIDRYGSANLAGGRNVR